MFPQRTLCLTRHEGEEVELYKDGVLLGKVAVVRITDSRCRLTFHFPDGIQILRGEIENKVIQGKESHPSTPQP